MSRWAALLTLVACASASPPLRPPPVAKIYLEADQDAAGVAAQLEEQLQLEGYSIARGPGPGVEHVELGIRRPPSPWPRAGENAYTLKVGEKVFESLDQACLRGAAESLFACHARTLLARAREAGALQ